MVLAGNFLSFLGSLIGGGLNMLSQSVANEQRMELAQYQNQWQQQENERAFARALEMWNLENAYNTPLAQRQRLEAAGANPMLAFGNGVNISTGNSSGYPTYEPAKAVTPEIGAYTGWNLNLNGLSERLQRQKIIDGQADLLDAQVNNVKADTVSKLLDNNLSKDTYDYSVESAKVLLDGIIKDNRAKDQNFTYNEEMNKLNLAASKLGIETSSFDLKFKQDVRAYRVSSEALNLALKDSQLSLNSHQKSLLVEQIKRISIDTLRSESTLFDTNRILSVWKKTFKGEVTFNDFERLIDYGVNFVVGNLRDVVTSLF